jgi:formylglycine-generating enzyme required for sulfatase activity
MIIIAWSVDMDRFVQVFRFDRFVLDLSRGCLRLGDQEIDLRPKTFEVLCYLAGNAGRLVLKRELFDAIWPNVAVGDDSLVQCIRELRLKLGDNDRRLIKTVSRRGYMLDATVRATAPQPVSDESATALAGAAQSPPPQFDLVRRVLRTIPARALGKWSAAAAALTFTVFGTLYLLGSLAPAANPGHDSLARNVPAHVPAPPHPLGTFRDCEDCPEMVALSAGAFTMGSLEDEPSRDPLDEGLPRRVVIKKPVAIGKFEVTVDQFATFVSETRMPAGNLCQVIVGDSGKGRRSFILGPPESSFRDPGFTVGGTHPAVCISWDDAQHYVAWLRSRTGKPYRLPTEAEWEYAARAGTQTMYSFGDDASALCAHGRFADPGSSFPWRAGCSPGAAGLIPVGQLRPNPWGIFDMHGNAWEWVEDCWTTNTSEIPTDGSAFLRPYGCSMRVVRGGSWANGPSSQRSAVRREMGKWHHYNNIGFRVALPLGG